MELYKIVGPGGECLNGGSGDWSLPVGGQPGDWRHVEGPLRACTNGLHLTTADQLSHWLNPERGVVYRVETGPELIDAGDKWVARSVRLMPRSRPMPDVAKLQAKRTAAQKRATRALAVKVPQRWRVYLSQLGQTKLPDGHPAAQYQNASAAANAEWSRAIRKADADYQAALLRGVMPD